MKTVRQISGIIVGLVFMFSGVVKAIDPLGSAYKFHDYFVAFNMEWLIFLSLPLAILLCLAEFIAGFAVISGIRQKEGILGVTLLMLFFTPLTLYLAITNPISDCGCFGDAIHLTNWETFWKNVVLLIPTIIIFTGIKQVTPLFNSIKEWALASCVGILFALFSAANLKYLPLIDFLPYKVGVRIVDQMTIPEGAESDQYMTTFIYERNGEQREFTLDNFPFDDTTWVFVDQITVLLQKGYEPPINNFIVTTFDDGIDMTNQILHGEGYTLLMIAKKLEDVDSKKLLRGFETGRAVIGIQGEFQCKGYNIMMGYYNNPEANEQSFTEDGWLKSGDTAIENEDGTFKIIGRMDDMIIRGSENIYPAEIEIPLEKHPSVETVATFGFPSEEYGQEVAAFVVLKKGSNATEKELKDFLTKKIEFTKVPTYIFIVGDEDIPLNGAGKVERNKLLDIAKTKPGFICT